MDRESLTDEPDPDRIRVYRVIARLNVGGPAKHVMALTRLVAPDSVESRLFVGGLGPGERDLTAWEAEPGIPIETVPGLAPVADIGGDLRALWWLYRRFRRDRPSIVHTHTAKAGAVGRIAAALAGVPVRIHTFHGHVLGGSYFTPTRTAVYRFTERVLARFTQRLLSVSDGQADELATVQGIAPRDRFTTVPLGLDLRSFTGVERSAARSRIRAELGLQDDARLVAVIGRVVPVKNHALLLGAVARSRVQDLRVLVVGDGESALVEELRSLAGALGLGDRVHWLGWRQDIADLHAAADLVAVPSHDEGTPVAIIEALAAGTPVVARAVGGVPEMLEGIACCRLVGATTPGAFAAAMDAALESGPMPPGERAAVRAETARRYSVERLARDIEAVYRLELARAGVGRTLPAEGYAST